MIQWFTRTMVVAVVFVAFLLLFSLYGFFLATHPPRYITKLTPHDLGWAFEEIRLTTEDNIKLAAWFVPSVKKSASVIVLLHGYPADKANLLEWASFLHKDFNLLFVDFRYFGASEGSLTTIGYHEQKDLKAALNYLQKKRYTKIGVMGFSLGGAVGILTGAKDKGVKALVSDSAFANIDLMGHAFYEPLFVLKYPLTLATILWAKLFLGIDASDIAPERAASHLTTPILLIHSKQDETISFENAKRLQNALKHNPKAQFLFPDKGRHGFIPASSRLQYQQTIQAFFKRYL